MFFVLFSEPMNCQCIKQWTAANHHHHHDNAKTNVLPLLMMMVNLPMVHHNHQLIITNYYFKLLCIWVCVIFFADFGKHLAHCNVTFLLTRVNQYNRLIGWLAHTHTHKWSSHHYYYHNILSKYCFLLFKYVCVCAIRYLLILRNKNYF